ncbi:MAG TPA: PilN domain-containing protein [Candidatus Saccharimonadales bacterium]|nr:PilN domain-containing protein [Candidatus Saccharimonadales bacterium]
MSAARLNLAPEVYQSSQREKRRRKIARATAIAVSVIALAIVGVGLVIAGGQKLYLDRVNGQIKDSQTKVKSYTDLQDAATAQQHLKTLNDLTQSKARFSKFFEVLQEFAPQGVAATKITISESNAIEMTGSAKSYDLVTKLVKALEASNTKIGKNSAATNQPFFSSIQLSDVTDNGGNQGISFKLTTLMSSEVVSGK